MISPINMNKRRIGETETIEVEYRGLSTDLKPTLPAQYNGSVVYEMDTMDVYMYDGEHMTWHKQ